MYRYRSYANIYGLDTVLNSSIFFNRDVYTEGGRLHFKETRCWELDVIGILIVDVNTAALIIEPKQCPFFLLACS